MKIYICGDSTAASYSQEEAPMVGWGQVLGEIIDVPVENRAMAGRSSKSYLAEGRLQKIETEIEPGDLLLIQFTDGDVMVRNGKVLWDEDNECLELYDADVDSTIPFIFLDTEEDGVFAIRFLANDAEVFFDIVDQDTIINDIYDILSSATPNSAIEEEEAAEFAEADEAA